MLICTECGKKLTKQSVHYTEALVRDRNSKVQKILRPVCKGHKK